MEVSRTEAQQAIDSVANGNELIVWITAEDGTRLAAIVDVDAGEFVEHYPQAL